MAATEKHEILLESGTNEVEIIEFYLGSQSFGINVHKLREIVPYDPDAVTRVPESIPSMIGMLLFINIVLGFVSRIAPQMNAFAIGFPLTLSAGLVGIAATLPMLETPVVALLKIATDIFSGG